MRGVRPDPLSIPRLRKKIAYGMSMFSPQIRKTYSTSRTAVYHRQSYSLHKEEIRKYQKKWRDNHDAAYLRMANEKACEKARAWALKQKLIVFLHYSDGDLKCACCGERRFDFLSLDHVDGKGSEHRREIAKSHNGTGTRPYFAWFIQNNYPSGYRILCFNCNLARFLRVLPAHRY